MKIAIIAAMRKELDLILAQMPGHRELPMAGGPAYAGQIGLHDVTVTQCGIGKVNSALRTRAVIETFHPDLIINSGVAGGLDTVMHIGDTLVPEHVAYHDVWCGPGTVPGQADGCPRFFTPWQPGLEIIRKMKKPEAHFGLLCSGDTFVSKPEEVTEIKSKFPEALGCDMESASIAQTCFLADVQFMIIRVMSDMPRGGENISEYNNFWNDAPRKTFSLVRDLIERL